MYSQPSVAFGRCVRRQRDGVVYSMDVRRFFASIGPPARRIRGLAPIAAPITGYAGTRYDNLLRNPLHTAYALMRTTAKCGEDGFGEGEV